MLPLLIMFCLPHLSVGTFISGKRFPSPPFIYSHSVFYKCILLYTMYYVYKCIMLYTNRHIYCYRLILISCSGLHFFSVFPCSSHPRFGQQEPLQLALCPSDTAPSILAQPSGTRCSWLALYLICPNPGISRFSKEPYFLLVEIVSK